MLRTVLIVLSIALLGSASAQRQAPTPTRIALVIGNSAYSAVNPLPNAALDATLVAAELRRLNFYVVEKTDLDGEQLATEIAAFGQRLRAGGPETVSFFYYAGHAAQDQHGVNYLIPTDATTRTPEALREEATPLQLIFNDINAANNPVNVIVLDACRNWYEGEPERESVRLVGLRDMGEVANVFVGLSTAPGHTSDDGFGEHSPYTTRLLEALRTSADQPLTLVFDDIQALVNTDTNSELNPQFFNGLSRERRWCLINGPNCGDSVLRPGAFVGTNPYLRTLDRERLLAFTAQNMTFVDTLLVRRDLLAASSIDTPVRLSHFLAVIAQGSRGFRTRGASFSFTPGGLGFFFPDKFPTPELAVEYAGNPERIANRLFGDRMGNGTEGTGDGWRYRGRGFFLLTGRANYGLASSLVRVDLVANPDLMSDPEINVAVAAAIWRERNLNAAADAGDLARIVMVFAETEIHAVASSPAVTEEGRQANIENLRRFLVEARRAVDNEMPPPTPQQQRY